MDIGPMSVAILALENALLDSDVRGSVERLDELLADDFREFTASGDSCDKRACLEALPQQHASRFEIECFEARALGPFIILATYRLSRIGGDGAQSLRSSIWRLDGSAWRLVFHQGTPAQRR